MSRFAERVMGAIEWVYPWTDYTLYGGWKIEQHIARPEYRLKSPSGTIMAEGRLTKCVKILNEFKRNGRIPPQPKNLVLMVHGMGRLSSLFYRMGKQLAENGVASELYRYPCPGRSLEVQTNRLRTFLSHLEDVEEISFVTQSYGALVVRSALAEKDPWREKIRLGRMVMIVPPNQGSWVAEQAHKAKPLKKIIDQDGWSLTSDAASKIPPPPLPFAIIAGGAGRDSGFLPIIPGDNDGLIAVDETWLDGAADHTVIPTLHFLSAANKGTLDATTKFLLYGAFSHSLPKQTAVEPQSS